MRTRRLIPDGLLQDLLLEALGFLFAGITYSIGELLVARGWKRLKKYLKRRRKRA